MSSSNWYPSLWVERRAFHKYVVNPRERSSQKNFKEGVVFRIYDGKTLHEEACDDWDAEVLRQRVVDFVDRVKKVGHHPSQKAYVTPSWADRLKADLDPEIIEQVPRDVSREEWVHFATPQGKTLFDDDMSAMQHVAHIYDRAVRISRTRPDGDPGKEFDYLLAQMRLERDDFIFIDSEVRMTQTLLRNMAVTMVMKNGESARCFVGGIGGRECVEVSDQKLADSFDELNKIINAERLKPGRYTLLMNPAITGLFAHEAFGHSQEGDTWARGRSKAKELFEKKERVGNEHATIINNPAVYKNGSDPHGAWGSYYFDEEGWLAQEHYLVKEGYLQSPMTHLSSSIRLGVPRTANGKREAWTNGMYTRQTNTYFSAGDKTLDQMMSSIKEGFLATAASGGMEDPKGMGIQVGIEYLEEIKDGKLTGKTFRGPGGGSVQMTGYVPDYLNAIVAKSKIDHFDDTKDESHHPWNDVGGCGKYHKELVNAGAGGPYMIIEKVHLG